MITSHQNAKVKDIVHLRDARQRSKRGRFVIDGLREISRALDGGVDIQQIFVCPELCDDEADQLLARLKHAPAERLDVVDHVMERLAFGQRALGVLAVATPPEYTLERIELPPRPRIAVLEGIEKPGNVGAVLRSADAAGIDAVLLSDARTDLFNPNTIRASLGTVFTLPIACADAKSIRDWLQSRGIKLYATRPEATLDYTGADLSGNVALILGSEAEGLGGTWSTGDVTAIRLPMLGRADSLNVSAAAAVLFYESLRQK